MPRQMASPSPAPGSRLVSAIELLEDARFVAGRNARPASATSITTPSSHARSDPVRCRQECTWPRFRGCSRIPAPEGWRRPRQGQVGGRWTLSATPQLPFHAVQGGADDLSRGIHSRLTTREPDSSRVMSSRFRTRRSSRSASSQIVSRRSAWCGLPRDRDAVAQGGRRTGDGRQWRPQIVRHGASSALRISSVRARRAAAVASRS